MTLAKYRRMTTAELAENGLDVRRDAGCDDGGYGVGVDFPASFSWQIKTS